MVSSLILVLNNTFNLQKLYVVDVDILWIEQTHTCWDSDRYPTHYCCIDPEQIAVHYHAIWHLVIEGKVKTALLHDHFLNFYPQATNDSRFCFLKELYHRDALQSDRTGTQENYPTSMSSIRVGKQRLLSPALVATRYAIRLGYQEVGLVGLEQLLKDDINSSVSSFTALRDEIVQQALDVSIVTCDRPSELHNQGIFPYHSLESLLGQQQLGALVIPTQVHEGDRLLQNLRLWQIPAFTPFLHMQGREKVRLIFTFTGQEDASITAAIQTAYSDSPILQRYFHAPEFHFFLLPEGEDVYIKDGNVPLGKKGFASGPNQQFFQSLFAAQDCGPYAFFLETDCLPLRPDWLGALCDAVQTTDEFWVMGSHYRGTMGLFKHFGRHINGSAVYAVGNPNFMAFVEEWQAILNEVVANQNPIVAYDSVLEYFFYYEFVSDKGTGKKIKPDSKGWQLFQRIAAYLRYSDYILNYSSPTDQIIGDEAFQTHLQHFRTKHENAYLIHNKSLCDVAYRQL